MVSNSHELVLSEHQPFTSLHAIIQGNQDMHSKNISIEVFPQRVKIRDTDEGRTISAKIVELENLLDAYRRGVIKQKG